MRVKGRHDVEIGFDERRRRFRKPRLHDAGNSGEPFSATVGFLRFQTIEPRTRMGVDDAEGRRLLLQVDEDAHQHDVLDHIGKAAGVKGVTIVHGSALEIILMVRLRLLHARAELVSAFAKGCGGLRLGTMREEPTRRAPAAS